MKKLFAHMVLRRFNRRRRILIEPNPHTMRGVFERAQHAAPLRTQHSALSPQHWDWPRGTWFQARRDQLLEARRK